jgi:periplasmic protein TonB
MGVYTHSSGNWLTRRGAFLVALILFHILLFMGLKSGFAVRFLESITPPIVADIINEVKPEEPPPPPPTVKLEIPPVQVPPVVIDIQIPQDISTTAISNVTDKPAPPPPPPPPRQVVTTKLIMNPKSTQPDVNDYYPNISKTNEEEGVAKIKICVGTNGRVKTADLDETSGFTRLDEAAVRVAKLYRFTPPTVDGKPIDNACATMPIRFKLSKN